MYFCFSCPHPRRMRLQGIDVGQKGGNFYIFDVRKGTLARFGYAHVPDGEHDANNQPDRNLATSPNGDGWHAPWMPERYASNLQKSLLFTPMLKLLNRFGKLLRREGGKSV